MNILIRRQRQNSILPNTFRDEKSNEHGNAYWSTIFFFLGSVFYLTKAVWNLIDPDRGVLADAEARHIHGPLSQTSLNEWDMHDALKALGPLMYVLNGIADTAIASRSKAEHARGEISSGLIFTFAASLDMVTAIISGGTDETLTYSFHSLARHSYVVYSVTALFCKKYLDYKETARRINKAGDILFFLGSLIDVVTSYFTRPGASPDWNEVDIWALVSASFWVVDALFFVVADLVESSCSLCCCCCCCYSRAIKVAVDEDGDKDETLAAQNGTA